MGEVCVSIEVVVRGLGEREEGEDGGVGIRDGEP